MGHPAAQGEGVSILDQFRFLTFGWRDAIEIGVVAYGIYRLLLLLHGTRAVQMLIGIVVLVLTYALAWIFNFLIGGLSGVFLSDTPSDVTTHGSFFSMAHFHYTIMGGLVFTFFAAIYYWFPKMTGFQLNERLGKIHFWTMFLSFNSTFMPLFAIGFLAQPRRAVTYAPSLQFLTDWASISAFCLGASMLLFLSNFVYSLVFARIPAGAR